MWRLRVGIYEYCIKVKANSVQMHFSAFIQRSWLIRNWTIPLLRVDAAARLSIYLETSSLGSIARLQ